MLIGHYGAAFAIKTVKPKIPLWHLFVAVQLVDFAWAILILAGVEKARLEAGFLDASILDLYHMPFTHALPSALLWAAMATLLYGMIFKSKGRDAALFIGLAVFSHWVLDLLVHTKDLELWWGGTKVGFGLWSSIPISQALELGLFVGAAWLYWRSTKAATPLGKSIGLALAGLLVMVQFYSLIPPPPFLTISMFAVQALLGYMVFAVIAWQIDRSRKPA